MGAPAIDRADAEQHLTNRDELGPVQTLLKDLKLSVNIFLL